MSTIIDKSRNSASVRAIVAALAGAAGGAIAIAVREWFSASAAFPLMFVPFATSIVLVMGMPESAQAQPRTLVGGHIVATLVGLLIVKLTGPSPWAAAAAVGLSMVAMRLTGAFLPPAGIDPLVIVVNDMSWSFLFVPVAAGAIALALFAFAWHNLMRPGSWPERWW